MRRLLAAAALVGTIPWVVAALWAEPRPEPPGVLSLQEVVADAVPGEEIVIPSGSYRFDELTVEKPLTLRAEGEVVLEGKVVVRLVPGEVTFRGFTFQGGGSGIEVEGLAAVRVQGCAFRDCARGVYLARGTLLAKDTEFVGCWTGLAVFGRAEVRGCTFSENETGVKVEHGGSVQLLGSRFTRNASGVAGEYPCQVTGAENRFSENGLDLWGDVDPALRVPTREPAEEVVVYPSGAYRSLQEAVDALVEGGRLLLASPVAESATITRSITVEPQAPGRVQVQGAIVRGIRLLAFSLVGAEEVTIRRLEVNGLVCGPKIGLRLERVSLRDRPLRLTGDAALVWEEGIGGLELEGEATAQVENVLLQLGVVLREWARARLRGCQIFPGKGAAEAGRAAVEISDLATLEGQGLIVMGGVSVGGWTQVKLEGSQLLGPVPGGFRPVLHVGPFANVELQGVTLSGGEAGILLSRWGNPRLILDGVTIFGSKVGLGAKRYCSEFEELGGLWTPPLSPAIELGPGGMSFQECENPVCPACSQWPWPVGLCEKLGLVARELPAEVAALLGELAAARAEVGSLRAECEVEFHFAGSSGLKSRLALAYSSPDKFWVEVGTGSGGSGFNVRTIYVCDGTTLWEYTPYLERVERIDLAALRREFPEGWEAVYPSETTWLIGNPLLYVYPPSVTYLGSEELCGEEVYVFEGLPGRDFYRGGTRVRLWIGPEGIWHKGEYYLADGSVFLSWEMVHLEVGARIPPEEFTFRPPEGVEVQDGTPAARARLRKKEKLGGHSG